jgi:hypothetical protein
MRVFRDSRIGSPLSVPWTQMGQRHRIHRRPSALCGQSELWRRKGISIAISFPCRRVRGTDKSLQLFSRRGIVQVGTRDSALRKELIGALDFFGVRQLDEQVSALKFGKHEDVPLEVFLDLSGVERSERVSQFEKTILFSYLSESQKCFASGGLLVSQRATVVTALFMVSTAN